MSYCLNPDCLQPKNLATEKFCLNCQTPLLLNNRYRTLKVIGRGVMGRTFLAVDQQDKLTESLCVIRQLFPQTGNINSYQKANELFEAEVASLEKLGRHPQIPNLYDYFRQNEYQYLVQEWIEGDNLTQVIEKKGVFSDKGIYQILKDLLPVLEFVHQCKIIHRDIKPENIICRRDGTLFLVDFGAATVLTGKLLQQTGTVMGSPEYMAPEQLRGKTLVSSDIFSLGVTCLYLLTGISPFNLYSDIEDAWVWRDYLGRNTISSELGQILDKMISKATARRYQSIKAIWQDLQHFSPEFFPSGNSEIPLNCDLANTDLELDSTQLQNYLEIKDWQKANQETERLLLQATCQERRNWLERDDLEKLTCDNLYLIDRLWKKYSEGNFGFSVQHSIWNSLNQKNYRHFGKQVGWHLEGRWILIKHLDFSISAPKGHLPAISWWFGHAIWGLKGLFLKLDACDTEQILRLQENYQDQAEWLIQNDNQNPAQ